MNEITKEYMTDISEKKRTATGARHRAPSTHGPGTKVTMPVDTMSPAERREYTKPGPLKLGNIGPMPLKQFKKQSEHDQRLLLAKWTATYGVHNVSMVAKMLGCCHASANTLLDKLDVKKQMESSYDVIPLSERVATKEAYKALFTKTEPIKTTAPRSKQKEVESTKAVPRGFSLNLNTVYGADDFVGLAKILKHIPIGHYSISLAVQQVANGGQEE